MTQRNPYRIDRERQRADANRLAAHAAALADVASQDAEVMREYARAMRAWLFEMRAWAALVATPEARATLKVAVAQVREVGLSADNARRGAIEARKSAKELATKAAVFERAAARRMERFNVVTDSGLEGFAKSCSGGLARELAA